MPQTRYIHASEIGSYVFCHRSWQLGRQNKPSLLQDARTAGTAFHQRHSDVVEAAPRARVKALRLVAPALVLSVLLLLWWALSSTLAISRGVASHVDQYVDCSGGDFCRIELFP